MNASDDRQSRYARLICAAVATLMFGASLILIHQLGVNVPELDQFSNATLYAKIGDGSVSLRDFIAQHNEQRVLMPRLVWASLAVASGGNVIWETYANWFFALVAFIAIGAISHLVRDQEGDATLRYLALFLSLCAVASWIQYGNFLFGFALLWFMQSAFVCGAIAVLCAGYPAMTLTRTIAAAVLVAAATWSTASGMLAWLALLPCLWSWITPTHRLRAALIWIGAAVITSALYFVGYVTPNHVPSPEIATLWRNTWPLIEHIVVMAGFPLAQDRTSAALTGGALIIIWLSFAIAWLFTANTPLGRRRAPWISLGAFALLFIGAVSLARVSLHVYAEHYKYTTTTLLLLIAVVQLVFQWLSMRRRRWLLSCAMLITGALGAQLVFDSIDHTAAAREYAETRRHALACYTLKAYAPESCLRPLSPSAALINRHAGTFEALGYYRHPKDLEFIESPERLIGYLDLPAPTGSPIVIGDYGSLNLGGWTMPENMTSDLVFIAVDDAQRFSAAARIGTLRRPDVVKNLNDPKFLHSGWRVTLPAQSIPPGTHTLSAWRYHAARQSFLRLRGAVHIERVSSQ